MKLIQEWIDIRIFEDIRDRLNNQLFDLLMFVVSRIYGVPDIRIRSVKINKNLK